MNKIFSNTVMVVGAFLFLGASAIDAQSSAKLLLSPEENRVYTYHSQAYSNQKPQMILSVEQTYQRSSGNSYIQKSKAVDVRLFNHEGMPVFWMGDRYARGSSDARYADLLQHLVVEKELFIKGGSRQDFDSDAWLQEHEGVNEGDAYFKALVGIITPLYNSFWLNEKLKKGKTLRFEKDNRKELGQWRVVELTSDYAVISASFSAEEPVTETDGSVVTQMEMVCMVENSSGLLLFMGSAYNNEEGEFSAMAIWRDDFEVLHPLVFFEMQSNFEKGKIRRFVPPYARCGNRAEAEHMLAELKPQCLFYTPQLAGPKELVFHKPSNRMQSRIKVTSIRGFTRYQEELPIFEESSRFPNLFLYEEGLASFPGVGFGSNSGVSKVVVELDEMVFYGEKELTLFPEDVGKRLSLTRGEFQLSEWSDSCVVLSEISFSAFNHEGKLLKKRGSQRVWPQYELTANLLGLKLEEVSAIQAWLYAPLFREDLFTWQRAFYFDEPVAKIVVTDAEGSLSLTRTIETY